MTGVDGAQLPPFLARARGGPLAAIGLAVLCSIYAVIGAALLWWLGLSPVRALAVAGGAWLVLVAGSMVLLKRLGGRRAPVLSALAAVHVGAAVTAAAVTVMLPQLRVADFGDPAGRVVSPDGSFEVITYEFNAMIDPGWTLVVRRVGGGSQEWFWFGVESPAPTEVAFAGDHTVEVSDDWGQTWTINVDPESLEPSDRYCLRPEYCYRWPLNQYTRTAPAPRSVG